MTVRRLALATCSEVPDLDDEGRLLLDALRDAGAEVVPVVWDDADADWAAHDLVVVRSTWDYAERRGEFLAWADRVSGLTRLENPPALLRWTTDKRYLADLAAAGVPTVPSAFVAPGEDTAHPYLDVEHVVKPSVGAGSRGALRFGADEADRSRAHVDALTRDGLTALVQPYLAEVDTAGETGVVCIDGEISHAFRKGALLAVGDALVEGLFKEEEITAREPSPLEVEVARRALAAVPGGSAAPLYARVDLLPTPDGPLLLELELCEPSFFLDTAPERAASVAAAFLRRA
ncbi:RimK family alpha-L-glutamate ligase [Nocardioides sp. CFH 31398]|uniref:ATP-grasp domain-containing protein n=1 Tax=Nocardioides sp. CFH 31398 TaxID=2919579 RepID=UPI001F051DC6|nr:hypothetical protein [Nocardioides sp. CFH 31398]MCH1866678.1 hypothetical protein [Nocardioides sp. CFH 31398]